MIDEFPPGYVPGHSVAAAILLTVCVLRRRSLGRRLAAKLEPHVRNIAQVRCEQRLHTPPEQRGVGCGNRLFRAAWRDPP